ncbi:MAG TPA: hypothetical protein VGR35_05215 [Tepidisphaeraceae bacterium]|nr:hypothetical protein [Tepidisphaeraceae bacterium]
MLRDIRESDWKVLRELKPLALARYCDRVLTDVVALASDGNQGSHERYLAVFSLIQQRDEVLANAFNSLSRSNALWKLAAMRKLDLLTEEEFFRFSPETRQAVDRMLSDGVKRQTIIIA